MKILITTILLACARLFAEAPKLPAGGDNSPVKSTNPLGGSSFIWIMLVLLVVWYFLLILPQQRKEKKRKAMLEAMKKGDKVVTIGGMFGIIERIEGDVTTLKVGSNTIEFMKSAISRVVSGPNAEKPEIPKT
jgi:preprotein translocase subunit YajC